MRKEIIIWQIIATLISLTFALVIRESVQNRLKLEAEIEVSRCVAGAHRDDTGDGYCYDILNYKNRSWSPMQ